MASDSYEHYLPASRVAAEVWPWYVVGVLSVVCRYTSQWLLRRSWRGYKWEDYLMLFVTCSYTIAVSTSYAWSQYNLRANYPDQPLSVQRNAGIIDLLNETAMIVTIWGIKSCLLGLYARLSQFQTQMILVKIMAVFVAVSFVVVLVCLFAAFCHPFRDYLLFESSNEQCWRYTKYYIVHLSLNVSSDILILCIPISLITFSSMPLARKLGLCCIFGMGIFVVVAAILSKVHSFLHPWSTLWELWYVRESTIALLVANLPLCWPLVRACASLRHSKDDDSENAKELQDHDWRDPSMMAQTTTRTWGSIDLDRVNIEDVTDLSVYQGQRRYTPPEYTRGW